MDDWLERQCRGRPGGFNSGLYLGGEWILGVMESIGMIDGLGEVWEGTGDTTTTIN